MVFEYLTKAGLMPALETLNFNLVGYGCTTCIGNSGPLPEAVSTAVKKDDLVVAAVLSGNRNFEGRINPQVKANYLASPPLVVAYALAGRVDIDMASDPLGTGSDGEPVYLKDIWPTPQEVDAAIRSTIDAEMFRSQYEKAFEGDANWQHLPVPTGDIYAWDDAFHLHQEAALLRQYGGPRPADRGLHRHCARWPLLGDSITTDHISPAGSIAVNSPAGQVSDRAGRARRRISIPTARGAATTK